MTDKTICLNYHVMPVADLRDHEARPDCWCRPVDDEGVFVHNAMDFREKYETGELLPS